MHQEVSTQRYPLDAGTRRRAIHRSYLNAILWALGSGLASTTLVVYLALELGAAGLGISLLLAAPALVGASRWWFSGLIGRVIDRKRFCLACYVASAAVLAALPVLAAPGVLPSAVWSLAALVILWCVYHLLEYLGTIALWSWLADLVPRPIRGRFIGWRESYLVSGRIVAMIAAGLFTYFWRETHDAADLWIGYAIAAGIGAALMLVAPLPLVAVPAAGMPARSLSESPPRRLLAPLGDPRFLRLLAFGCWFSFFNGITQSAQNIYARSVLEFSLMAILSMQVGMRLGQLGLAPPAGRLADRIGNRPVMFLSQLIVAAGLGLFLLATPAQAWWLAGAYVCWIAYAGLNVALPNLMLKLSPNSDNAPHIACYFAVTGACYGLSTIAGGVVFDALAAVGPLRIGALVVDHYQLLFAIGLSTRAAAVVLIARIVEPGALSVRGLLARTVRPLG